MYHLVADAHTQFCIYFLLLCPNLISKGRAVKNDFLQTRLHEVQQIPANFLWTLHTFVTPRGVELIFGSIQPNPTDPTDTAIYRFNEIGEKFEMVEKIASDGCTSAVGVVLGEDSFVALANKYDSIPDLKIYKYSKYTDHYHYYQSIRFNSPILSTTVFYTGG